MNREWDLLTQQDLITFIGNLALNQGLSTRIRTDPTDQSIQAIASQTGVTLSTEEIKFVLDNKASIEKFCLEIQPIVYDGDGGKSR